MSEHSGARERSIQGGASKRGSGTSEQANGQASGPVLTSGFLVNLAHCAVAAVAVEAAGVTEAAAGAGVGRVHSRCCVTSDHG